MKMVSRVARYELGNGGNNQNRDSLNDITHWSRSMFLWIKRTQAHIRLCCGSKPNFLVCKVAHEACAKQRALSYGRLCSLSFSIAQGSRTMQMCVSSEEDGLAVPGLPAN